MKKTNPFDAVRAFALTLPGVTADTRGRDGEPILKVAGRFMAGLATHPSAEPGTLVVRITRADRRLLLDEAPAAYYLTDYYSKHAVILVRLARVTPAALRDLLTLSRRLTVAR